METGRTCAEAGCGCLMLLFMTVFVINAVLALLS